MKLLITDLDYTIENGTGVLLARVFGRDDQGNRQMVLIEGTRPFFGIPANEPIPSDPRIVEVEEGWTDLKGNPLKRIFTRYPKDVASRVKCQECKGEDTILKNCQTTDCTCNNGQIEIGLRGKFSTTFQADIVYPQVLRIYYGLNGAIEVPSNRCHISQVKKSDTKIIPRIGVMDIETVDSVDTSKAPEPIPCITIYDNFTDTYHIFCHGFKKYELAQVSIRIHQHWMQNLIPKLQKYNFQNPKIQFHAWDLEKQMAGDLINFVRTFSPDMFATWNGTFDLPYTIQRMKNLSIPYQGLSETGNVYYNSKEEVVRIEGRTELDAMEAYAGIQMRDLVSKSLDYCSNKEFGIGKMKRTSIKEMMQRDPVGLLAYNCVDAMITHAMIQECQIYAQQQTLSEIVNVGLDNQSPLRITESFIMSYVKDRKILLPTTVHEKRDGKKEGGAFVHDVTIGIHKNVIILDFKGYYTSMMMSGNMCASTYVTEQEALELINKKYNVAFARNEDISANLIDNEFIYTPNGAMFRKDKKGVIPEILVHVRDQRNYHKKLMKAETDPQKKNIEDLIQNGFKRIGNIFYGQFKNPHFRLMNKIIAEAITSACETLTKRTNSIIENLNPYELTKIDKLSNYKIKVIYNDTDSIFIEFPASLTGQEMEIIGKALEKYINSIIPSIVKELFNIDKETCYIEIEFDDKKAMKTMLQMPSKTNKDRGAKKRYIYLSYNKDGTVDQNPHFVGVEAVRSDTSPMVVEVQTQLSKLILNDKPYSEVRPYLLNLHKNFSKTDPHQLLIKETIHAFDDAKSHSPQLIGALYANKFMGKSFKSGSSVYYIYLKSIPKGYPTHIQTQKWGNQKLVALCLNYNETIPSQFMPCIDYDKMRELVLEKSVESIIEAIGYSWTNILSGMSENKMKPITAVTLNNRQALMEI